MMDKTKYELQKSLTLKKLFNFLFAATCSISAEIGPSRAEELSLFDARLKLPLELEGVLEQIPGFCPNLYINEKRKKVAEEYYAEILGFDYTKITRDDRSDIGVTVNATRDGVKVGVANAINDLGKEDFCVGALLMYGKNGIIYAYILNVRT